MKKRNVASVVIVGAVALGIYLGQFWKGPGFGGAGSGWGGTDAVNGNSRPQARLITGTGSFAPTATMNEPTATSSPEFGLPSQTINVVIFENQFRLVSGDDPKVGRVVSLEELKKEAADTVGSQEGIRIRILKEKSAQEGARSDLLKSLADAGIKREEILERSEFVK